MTQANSDGNGKCQTSTGLQFVAILANIYVGYPISLTRNMNKAKMSQGCHPGSSFSDEIAKKKKKKKSYLLNKY